jgi:glutamate transport system permease protein
VDTVFGNFDLVLKAFGLTLELLVISGVLSLILGTVLAAFRVGPVSVLAKAGALYVNIFRNTPLLIIFIFVFAGLPQLGFDPPFLAKGVLALTVYTSSFVCEAVRSGINSVSSGQAEAARAIGMTFGQTMGQVVLPQAVRASVPPLASVVIALTKNTSVAAGFGLMEATARMRFFVNNDVGARYAIFITFAIGYIIIVEVLSAGAFGLERRWKVAR